MKMDSRYLGLGSLTFFVPLAGACILHHALCPGRLWRRRVNDRPVVLVSGLGLSSGAW